MARYAAYGFKHMYDSEEKGVYLNSSNDINEAIEMGARCPLEVGRYFAVYDTQKEKWVNF